jgi:uncharacterized protein (TIGR00251 family)
MLIKVKVFPNSKKEAIISKSRDSFEIYVKEKPEQNQANKRIIEILSSYFKLEKSQIKLVKGAKTQNKIFEIGDY